MRKFIQKIESQYSTAIPVIYSLISSLLFATTALTIKLVPQIPPTQVLYVRSLFTIIAIKFIVGDGIESYPQKHLTKLQWRGFCGGAGTVAWFWAVKLIQSSEVIVISKVSPLWTALIAAYITKTDKLTMKLMIIIIFCLFGVILIARPPFLLNIFGQINHQTNDYHLHLLGVLLALSSSVTQSIVQVIISSLAKQVNQITILQYFSFYTIILPMLFELYAGSELKVPSRYEWMILTMNSLSGGLAQFFMNRCFILGKLNKMSLVGQSQVIFSYLFDIFILNESINMLSVIGSILVCGCLIIIIAILFFGFCSICEARQNSLQGALNLLEKAQIDQSIYDQPDPKLLTWYQYLSDQIFNLFYPITQNNLSKYHPVFGSIPAVICMACFIPLILLVVFSYAMFKFITYEPKRKEFKYSKLPIKEKIPKDVFPPLSVFSFI